MCMKDLILGLAVGMVAGAVLYGCSTKPQSVLGKTKKVVSQKLRDIADNM